MGAATDGTRRSKKKSSSAAVDDPARRFFSALPDAAFYAGEQVQHLYLFGPVCDESLSRLRDDIEAASKGVLLPDGVEVAPRPIVLHINSGGGSMMAGLSMMSVFNECRLPICVCVDGMSASAATLVSVLAPYRVMAPLATCLVHDYSGFTMGQAAEMRFYVQAGDEMLAHTRDMYLRRTRVTPAQLDALMKRDLLLTAPECARYGLCDRVLGGLMPPVASGPSGGKRRGAPPPTAAMPLTLALRKTNLNHVRFACDRDGGDGVSSGVLRLDALLRQASDLKPVIVHCDSSSCMSSIMMDVAPVAARLCALPVPTYGVVDTQVSLENFLPVLLCTRRVMYSHASVVIHMVYRHEFAWMLEDVIVNTRTVLDLVRGVLRAYTRLPADVVDNIHARRTLLTAADCLRYGMVDEVVSVT